MNVLQLENRLAELDIFPTAREICNIIDMNEQSYSRKKKAETDIKQVDIRKLEQYYNVSLLGAVASSNNMVTISASCGNGVINADIDYLQLDNKQKYIYSFVCGDSMQPVLFAGDLAIIKVSDVIDVPNGIYCFTFGDEQYIKHLCYDINRLVISSDNKKYSDIVLSGDELDKIKIIGECVGIIRRF